jgi:hypothetical protein
LKFKYLCYSELPQRLYSSPFPYTTYPKARYQNIPKTFPYYLCTITNLTNNSYFVQSSFESPTLEFFAYHLPYSISRCLVTWQRIEVKLYKVSDGTRVVRKCLKYFLIPCFRSGCVWEWRNIPQTVCKKYTTFSTEWIVDLRSVNKIFPELRFRS